MKKLSECFKQWSKSQDDFEKLTKKLTLSDSELTTEESKELEKTIVGLFDSAKELLPHLPPELANKLKETLFSMLAIFGINPKQIYRDSFLDAQYIIETTKDLLEKRMVQTLDDFNDGKLDIKTLSAKMKNIKTAVNRVNSF